MQEASYLLKVFYKIEVESRGRVYEETESLKRQITAFADAMTTQDHTFGILILGSCGNGKTTMLNAFVQTMKCLDKQYNAFYFDMRQEKRRFDPILIEARQMARKARDAEEWERLLDCKVLLIDDAGTEPAEILDFGTGIRPLEELVEYRYAKQLFTIITSNLGADELKAKYDKRTLERLHEMMHQMSFEKDNYRRIV